MGSFLSKKSTPELGQGMERPGLSAQSRNGKPMSAKPEDVSHVLYVRSSVVTPRSSRVVEPCEPMFTEVPKNESSTRKKGKSSTSPSLSLKNFADKSYAILSPEDVNESAIQKQKNCDDIKESPKQIAVAELDKNKSEKKNSLNLKRCHSLLNVGKMSSTVYPESFMGNSSAAVMQSTKQTVAELDMKKSEKKKFLNLKRSQSLFSLGKRSNTIYPESFMGNSSAVVMQSTKQPVADRKESTESS